MDHCQREAETQIQNQHPNPFIGTPVPDYPWDEAKFDPHMQLDEASSDPNLEAEAIKWAETLYTASHQPPVIQLFDTMTPQSLDSLDPLNTQYGGTHYKIKAIQPIEYTMANNLGFCEGTIVKYITRHKEKGGADDIRKVIHYAEFILKFQYDTTLNGDT